MVEARRDLWLAESKLALGTAGDSLDDVYLDHWAVELGVVEGLSEARVAARP